MMGQRLSAEDFQFEYTEQPHMARRVAILKKHPEIKKLMCANGDPTVAVLGLVLCGVQVSLALLRSYPWVSMPMKHFLAVCVGSHVAAWIFLSLHEAAHGLVFGPNRPRLNKLYGLVANLALGWPVFAFFKKHHIDHHKYQGDVIFDIEYPCVEEKNFFGTTAGSKLLWMQMNPLLQMYRAIRYGPSKGLRIEELLNIVSVFAVDIVLLTRPYPWQHVAFTMLLSTFLATGINIVGIWGVATHTLFYPPEDTMSYYGWLNKFYLNFGYHMEHHDFPNIPSRLLPKVSQLAPEFYQDHHRLDSVYVAVLKFLHDSRLGLHSRLKRIIPSLRHAERH